MLDPYGSPLQFQLTPAAAPDPLQLLVHKYSKVSGPATDLAAGEMLHVALV